MGEIDLAGHAVTEYGLIDTHGSAVCDGVRALLRDVRRRGVTAPALDVLLAEVTRADSIGKAAMIHAAAAGG